MTTSYSNLSSSSKLASNIFHKHTYDIAIIPKGKDITDLGVKSTKSGDVIVMSCTTPGKQIATNEKVVWGPVYNIPYNRLFSGTFDFTFMYNTSFHEYISKWMSKVINDRSNKPAYYEDILGDIDVNIYSQANNKTSPNGMKYTMIDCWPVTIQGLALDSTSMNEYQTMSVSWSFREFTIKKLANGE
jgi:hypothetical protein